MGMEYTSNKITLSCRGGGSNRVVIPVGGVIRGGSGSDGGGSIGCTCCRIIPSGSNVGDVRVRIGGICSSNTGVPLGKGVKEFYPVNDLNVLNFWGTSSGDVIDIEYFVM